MSGKCSGCGHHISTVTVEQMKLTNKSSFRAIALKCPDCDLILGMQIDPDEENKKLLREIEQKIIKWK